MNEQSHQVAANDYQGASDLIRELGYVILKQAVSHEPLAILRERMDRDTQELLAYCDTIGGNPRELGHLQQGPPLSADYVFTDVAMNQHVNRVCNLLFDNHSRLTFYNGNTNCPGSTTQGLHMDGRHPTLAPEPVAPTTGVVVDIPAGPMNTSNGSIQLWPGTHVIRPEAGGPRVPEELESERRAESSPIQPTTEVGDVLIRDIRLWHRGVPNHSTRPRHMIALIISKSFAPSKRRLRFEKGCEDALEGQEIDANAEYVEGPLEYLVGPTRRIYESRKAAESAPQQT
ncbi:MAG: phytanoyl-CoA dioxygenase family protein [Gammaproteobacteria bacterium]|nr:phytanoyl-CoA dioxygenase family protein [Gammaproteobacteria bacterium]